MILWAQMDMKRVSGNNSTSLPVTSQYGGWNENGKYSCIVTLHLTCSSAFHPVQVWTHLQEKKSRPRKFKASAAVKLQQYSSGNLCSSLERRLPGRCGPEAHGDAWDPSGGLWAQTVFAVIQNVICLLYHRSFMSLRWVSPGAPLSPCQPVQCVLGPSCV